MGCLFAQLATTLQILSFPPIYVLKELCHPSTALFVRCEKYFVLGRQRYGMVNIITYSVFLSVCLAGGYCPGGLFAQGVNIRGVIVRGLMSRWLMFRGVIVLEPIIIYYIIYIYICALYFFINFICLLIDFLDFYVYIRCK